MRNFIILCAIAMSFFSCDVLLESLDPNGFQETQARNADYSVKRPSTSHVTLNPNLQQKLENAVWSGDLEMVKDVEALGANLNYGKGTNLPNAPLQTALSRQYSKIRSAKLGYSSSVEGDHLAVINYLKSKATNLSDCSGYNVCVIALMCNNSLSECKKAVNEWGMNANYADINHFLGRKDNYESMEFLFQHGLDASTGKNALKNIEALDMKTLELLLKNGASKRIDEKVDKYDHVLTLAYKDPKKIKLLLDYGANPSVNCDQTIKTCIKLNKLESAKLLLEAGVDPNKTCNEHMQRGMLTYAINNGSVKMANLIKSFGGK